MSLTMTCAEDVRAAMTAATPDPVEVGSIAQDPNTGRAVRIRWIDSGLAAHGWRSFEDMPQDVSTCESVGLWMGENERVVMIGSTRDADNTNWNEAQLIYKPCITATEWLS